MRRIQLHLSKKKQMSFVDKMMYIVAVLYPLAGVPQVIQIFTTKSAGDLALATYMLFVVFEAISLSYGIMHKLKPLVISCIIWIVYFLTVIAGIFLYA